MKLVGGHSLRFGVWLGVHPDDLQRAFRTWWEPSYADLELDGLLANRLPVWDCFAAPAHTSVNHKDQTPYVVGSGDELLARVLREEWPHQEVLAALPGL